MESLKLQEISLSGSHREMGRQHGESLREQIRAFVDQRLGALDEYLNERGRSNAEGFLELGAACLRAAKRWDPEGSAEHQGIAEAAGIPEATLFAVTNMTDVRDLLLYGPPEADEGCTACLLPPALTSRHRILAAQTWDLNPSDLDYVVALRRRPTGGPETMSVTCVGCLSLIGMNEHGLSAGTTNIKSTDVQIGVGYLNLLHRALAARTLPEAEQLLVTAPRAAAHTYWLANTGDAVEYECSAHRAISRRLGAQALVRTNHCLSAELSALEGEDPNSSSYRRFERATALSARSGQGLDTIRAVFSDRSDGVDSINRYAEDGQGTATNACIVCCPAERRLWACRGPADRGSWHEFSFD